MGVTPPSPAQIPRGQTTGNAKAMPNTTTWQLKSLMLFIAFAALFLTIACGKYAGAERVIIDRITPSAPCGDDTSLTVSAEFDGIEGAIGKEMILPSMDKEQIYEAKKRDEERRMSAWRKAVDARAERLRPEEERVREIVNRYRDRIEKQYVTSKGGHVHGYGVTTLNNEKGEPTDKFVLEIDVTEYIDQSTLPPEDRIPDCMEGVEVHYRIRPIMTIE